MNHFGKTLSALLGDKSFRQFAAECGIAPNTVRAVIEGQRCSRENLRTFCEKISHDVIDRFALVIAHLHDEAHASGVDVSKLSIRHLDGVNLQELDLSPEMNADLGLIAREAETEDDVREHITSLAHLIMRAKAAQADSKVVLMAAEDPAVIRRSTHRRVSISNTISDARRMIVDHHPELVIFDPAFGEVAALVLFHQLVAFVPGTRWLACTQVEAPAMIVRLVTTDIDGVVLKREPLTIFCEAVHKVIGRQRFLSPGVSAACLTPKASLGTHFSSADLRILSLLDDDKTLKEIGNDVALSERSMRDRIARLRSLLQVSGNFTILKRAVDLGIIPSRFGTTW